ncbi:hypothetical protein OHU34_45420 (plasmid) [Streptomyces sp. NBC_00080]|uniref:VMAP-C domain-containing protein n=1 Tax=unclassified Streptomyces TaxID=2593676 RepID=UPI001153FC65|nr:hypothetical protein [Streptomyces sp. SLBN-115]TQJ37871.1 hypothetical protein FBY34_8041 [Streptomyces sp. SLBN-115]
MVDVLCTSPSLSDAPTRRALARMLAHALNRTFSDDESTTQLAQEHLSWIVARCMEHREATESADALARIAGTVTGDDKVAAQLRVLSDWRVASARLSDEDLDVLGQLLEGKAVSSARMIARTCLQPFPVHLPVHCTDAWSVVLYLLRRNALPTGLPVFLVFLEHLAPELEAAAKDELRAWADSYAQSQGLQEQLAGCRARVKATPAAPRTERTGRVMFVLLADGLDEDYCVLQVWHQDGQSGQSPPMREGDERVRRHDLGHHVHQRLQQSLADIGRPAALTVEFWLPLMLANLPVAQWCRPARNAAGTSNYRVVVRSLDRDSLETTHSAWKQQWDQLIAGHDSGTQDPAPDTETLPGPPAPGRLLVLNTPPDREEGRRQLLDGIRAGAPAILWHRSDCTSRSFRQHVRDLTKGSLADLPARLGELQHQSDSLGTGPLSDLTLLWDDPNQPRPVLKALTSPDAVVPL